MAQDPGQPQAPAAAPAAQDQVPPGKWIKRCTKRGETDYCEVSFGRYIEAGGRKIWLSRAGILKQGDVQDIFVFVPLGASLSRGLAFRIDTNEPKPAAFSFCLELQGCQAITKADEALIAEMKKGIELQVQFTIANRPPLLTKVSLAGFTAAFDGPATEPAPGDPAGNAGAGAGAAAGGGKSDAPPQ